MKNFNKMKNDERVRDAAEEYMRLKGQDLSDRLENYSRATLQLISDISSMKKEIVLKSNEIITNSELSEEEVVKQLTELKENSTRR